MMKKRKWLVSLLAVVLTVTMLPIAAFAQTAERTTGLDLSNKTEAEANEAEGWSWSPDGEGGYTLVLENVNISAQSGDAITLPKNVDVDIILKGNNRISGETALFGVETAGGLVTIKGETSDASLTAVSNENSMWGTISISNLLIESGNVYTEGDGNVIDTFSMTGGSFTINQTFGSWAALHTVNRVSITGGRLEITTDETNGYAIYNYPSQDEGESGVYIGGNAEVVINKSNVGIAVLEKGSGISDGKIEIAGGTVKINSANIGLYTAVEDIILSGGNIEIISDNIALKAVKGNVDFTGADTGIKAPTPVSAGGEVVGTYHDIHQWASEWSYDDNGHWKACTNPGCDAVNEYSAHQGGTATCTQKAVCEICGQEYGEVDETAHTPDGTGWHFDENSHWNTCECGAKLNEAVHAFTWVTDKEATATEAGLKHEECTVCGYEKDAVEIPAAGTADDGKDEQTSTSADGSSDTVEDGQKPSGEDTPQTGDNSNSALWIALMLTAGAGLTAATIFSRKKKYSR